MAAHHQCTILLLFLLTAAASASSHSSHHGGFRRYVHRSSTGEEGLFDGMAADSPSPAPFGAPPPSTSVTPQPAPPEDNNSNWSPDKYQRIVYRGLQTAPACNALRYGSCIGQALNVQKKCDYLNRSCIR